MDLRAALLEQTRQFGDVIRGADPSVPVPTCPGWNLGKLFRHVGRGNRWAGQIVADRRTESLDPRDVVEGTPPHDADAAIDWLNQGAEVLIDAVEQVGADVRVWGFPDVRPAGWWIRRRLHETTVHRADAELALGVDYRLPAELAADAISEWIEILIDLTAAALPPLEHGRTLHLHAAEQALGPTGEWTIVHDGEGVSWSHAHAKGDVAVRGPVTDLLLALTRRRPAAESAVEIVGDAAVWDGWLERTPF